MPHQHFSAIQPARALLVLFTLALIACGSNSSPDGEIVQSDAATTTSRVLINTSQGDIVLQLYAAQAPITVANFLSYVDTNHYDGTIFHRIIPDFVIQGGGYDSGLNRLETGEPIQNEAANGVENKPYTVAMARTAAPHSARAQFFFNLADNDFLNFRAPTANEWGYAVFGEVTQGIEIVDQIATVETGAGGPFAADLPLQTVEIRSITRLP